MSVGLDIYIPVNLFSVFLIFCFNILGLILLVVLHFIFL